MFNGKHYDEYFIVHADQFPENKTDFTICLTIFRAVQRLQNFGMVSNATIMICDYDNPDASIQEAAYEILKVKEWMIWNVSKWIIKNLKK